MLTNTEKALRQFGGDGTNIFRRELKKADKIATAITSSSIRFESSVKDGKAELCYYADESYLHILNGRPPGSKLPPSIFDRKGRRLDLWFGARGIERTKSADFLIRRSIAEKGIKPVDVRTPAVEAMEPRIRKGVVEGFAKDLEQYGIEAITKVLQ